MYLNEIHSKVKWKLNKKERKKTLFFFIFKVLKYLYKESIINMYMHK